MVDRACDKAREELSARLDGESDATLAAAVGAHLETCGSCRTYMERLARVRSAVRLQTAEQVPDLSDEIVAAVNARGPRLRLADLWKARARTAAIAAAATMLVLAGAGVPWVDEPSDIAAAGEIVTAVRRAARELMGYRATYSITEHGWHPDVPVRRMRALIWFDAPEEMRLEVRDLTVYPTSAWPKNDIVLVARPQRWTIQEPPGCPIESLPECADAAAPRRRSVIDRAPFDGSTGLPTDIILPLETLASSGGFEVAGRAEIAGRSALEVELTFRQAFPLIAAIEQGGSWREFHPLDRVLLWVDERTWFPLRFDVIASDSQERSLWEQSRSLHDRPGDVLLSVRATQLSQPEGIPNERFTVPAASSARTAGFRPAPFSLVEDDSAPGYLGGLRPYRAGFAGKNHVLTYVSGMAWLKVTIGPHHRDASLLTDPALAEQIRLGGDGYVYYRPAGASLRRMVDVYARGVHAQLESNLPRTELLKVARSLGITGTRIPLSSSAGNQEVRRVGASTALRRMEFARAPEWLPRGYEAAHPAGALLLRSGRAPRTLVIFYRGREAEYGGFGIRIAQSPDRMMPPASGRFSSFGFHGTRARWMAEIGQMEWIEDGVYRSVSGPLLDLSAAVRIARSLR